MTMTDWKREFCRSIVLRVINLRRKAMLIREAILMVNVGYKGLFANCRS